MPIGGFFLYLCVVGTIVGGLSLGLLRWKQVPHRGCVLGRDLLRPPERASESPKELEPQHLPWSQRCTALVSVIPFVERGDSNLGREPERFRPAESWMGWNKSGGRGTDPPGWFLVS